ncbi:unnamed protein product [Sphenostylis stenocarpa]|uniref:SAC domain-containing protein n=1 Tax=Sphenostylis stenocarpa TaxID=92480 RepID=A0AA86W0B2_9FABA|nr:unnamed protein product [Sphenostylis stenocarpa]
MLSYSLRSSINGSLVDCHSNLPSFSLSWLDHLDENELGRYTVVLASNSSISFEGTRYLKRGVNDRGRVANDVETEQIVLDEEAGSCKGKMSSTVEKRPREMMLRREFANAVRYLNQILPVDNHLRFIHWDFDKFAKTKSANVLAVLGGVPSEALDLTGFYYSGKPSIIKRANKSNRSSTRRDTSLRDLRAGSGDLVRIGNSIEMLNSGVNRDRETDMNHQNKKDNFSSDAPYFQSGVLRTNCIDCLDRTNVAHGDALAQQYGGSAAHNIVFPERQGKWKATTQSREFLKSIKRYYSNAYTDGEKQDAINLYYSSEGTPALWELDSDYYLHVSGVEDDLIPEKCSEPNPKPPGGGGMVFNPIPACREDFLRIKLTSFDKLIEKTCSTIKNVRLCSEPDRRPGGSSGNSGVAPDAARMPFLKYSSKAQIGFSARESMEDSSAAKVASHETDDEGSHAIGFCDLNWLSSGSDMNEEDVFRRYLIMTSANEANGLYGGSLLGDEDESSEIHKHYAELCQAPGLELFQNDCERELHYADGLSTSSYEIVNDSAVEAEMKAALKEYDQVGADLGIIPRSCKFFADDPSWLTRWLTGEEFKFISFSKVLAVLGAVASEVLDLTGF